VLVVVSQVPVTLKRWTCDSVLTEIRFPQRTKAAFSVLGCTFEACFGYNHDRITSPTLNYFSFSSR